MSDNNINIAQELLRLTRETIIYGFSGIAVRVAGIILVPFYTRTFSPEDYGIIELANTFIQIMVTIVILGLDYSSGYLFYQTQDQDRRKEIMGTTIGIQMALSLLFLIVGLLSLDLLKISLFGAHPDGRMLTILALLAIPLSVVFKFVQIMLRFLRKPKSFSALSVGAAIITIVLGILLVVIIRFGIIGAVVAVLLSNLLASFTGIVWIHHWVKFGIVKELVKPLLQIGLPLVPAGIAWWALTLSNRFFLRDLDSLGAVGILAVSSKVVMMSSFAVNAIQMSWGPFALSLKE
ncbi:MAG: hypothetical protein FJ240_14020, partial [Nitrospira sp.]|nr:hypothetical protein [Nitrospira sp.]